MFVQGTFVQEDKHQWKMLSDKINWKVIEVNNKMAPWDPLELGCVPIASID